MIVKLHDSNYRMMKSRKKSMKKINEKNLLKNKRISKK